jgi:two-component system nitrogen regulation sensor histidine kinase NtrY
MAEESREIAQRRVEVKRRRRELIAVGVAAITLIAFVFAQTALPPLTKHTSLSSNLAVIILFNLSFLLLGLLLFLVGRNLAKVMFERRIEVPDPSRVRIYRRRVSAERVPALCLGRLPPRRRR